MCCTGNQTLAFITFRSQLAMGAIADGALLSVWTVAVVAFGFQEAVLTLGLHTDIAVLFINQMLADFRQARCVVELPEEGDHPNAGVVSHPADEGPFRAQAVVARGHEELVVLQNLLAGVRFRYGKVKVRVCGLGGGHGVDLRQPFLFLLKLNFQLLPFQVLPLQLKLGQGGVIGHKDIALFHHIALLHFYAGDGLGVRKEHSLNPVRGDRAGALLGVAPVFRHAHVPEGVNLHRLTAAPGAEDNAHNGGGNQGHRHHGDGNFLLFPIQLFYLKILHLRHFNLKLFHPLPPFLSAARRPKCDRSCRRRRQWPARG